MLNKLISVYTQSYLYHTQLSTADPDLYVSVLRYCLLESRYWVEPLNVSAIYINPPPPPPPTKRPGTGPGPPFL